MPLQELGFPEDKEEKVLDLTKLTFDQVRIKIRQERRKYYARNPAEPLLVTTAKEIVHDTTVNLEMIALARIAFVIVNERNVARMRKQIMELQNRLYAS